MRPLRLLGTRINRQGRAEQDVKPSRSVGQSLLDSSQLRYLQKLTFASGKLAWSGLSGEHRSRRRGLSPEFADFKSYSPGDDFRRIDWNTYARLDQLFIKESETTTERDIHIFVDLSPSMDWSCDEEVPTKLRYAIRIASTLGYLAIWHFDRCSIQGFGTAASHLFGPVQGRSNILRMLTFCGDLTVGPSASGHDVIQRHILQRKRPGRMIVVSDFHWTETADLRDMLLLAASRRWQTTLILVQDPAESDPSLIFDTTATVDLQEPETATSMHISGNNRSLDAYRTSRTQWLSDMRELAQIPGVTWLVSTSTDVVMSTLLQDLVQLRVLRR